MTAEVDHYLLTEEHSPEALIASLAEHFHLESEPERSHLRLFHDSFDWRIYQAGWTLCESRGSRQHQLILSPARPSGGQAESMSLNQALPAFPAELPPGRIRETLCRLLDMRALLSLVEVKSRETWLRLLDGEQKTVVRVCVEQSDCRQPGEQEWKRISSRLRLVPVRGYGKALQRTAGFIQQELGVKRESQSLYREALAAIGRKPLDYSSKLNFRLEPLARADLVAKQINLYLLEVLENNIPGTRADIDSEFLHDLRVAVRRTRSALTQIKGVFPEQSVAHFKERFAWVGRVTGPTRDMDVYLLGYEGYRNSLPEQFRGDLEPLYIFLSAHQKSEHRSMMRKLNSPHFRGLLKEWRAFLEAEVPEQPEARDAALPVIRVADKRIFRMYRRVMKEGLAIGNESPPEDLHELRKSCKKLRYLMEFFQSLYPRKVIQPLIKALKVLLDNLGEFQDLEVQAFKLRELAHQMLEEGEVPADTLLAMGMLVDSLIRRQQLARSSFSDRFEEFSRRGNRDAFRQLFASSEKGSRG